MRKFTLLIASLFITLGAMAQTVVTTINTEKVYTLLCKATDHDGYIGYNDGVINGRSNVPAFIKFEATEGGYYIKIDDKYINGETDGSAVTADATAKTIWKLNAPAHTANVVTFSSNGKDYYLNNNLAASPYLKTNNHNGGPGSSNACSLWTLTEYNKPFIADAKDFKNGKVYTFVTSRGQMGAIESSNNVISTAKTAVSDTNTDYFKWAVYKSANEKYYLYNVGKGMYFGQQVAAKDSDIPMSEAPVSVTFKNTSKAGYYLMFTSLNDGSCVANHSPSLGQGLITWYGGWTNLTDDGSCHLVTEEGELSSEVLAEIEAAVQLVETDNTKAVEALDVAIADAQAKAEAITEYLGDGLGQYTFTGEYDYEAKFTEIVAFRQGITSTTIPSIAEVEAKTAEVNAIVAAFVINQPEDGRYYRIAYDYGGTIGKLYMQGVASTVKGVQFTAETGDASIWQYINGKLLSYTAQQYLKEDGNTRGLQDEGGDVTFVGSPREFGKYNIACTSYLHANSSGTNYFLDHCGGNSCATHDMILEEVADPTAIENVEVENAEQVIYDLTGRRVEIITEAGIYIVNGVKVLVK